MTHNNQIEIWNPVLGYEGIYEASSLGRIRSLDRVVPTSIGEKLHIKGRLMKPLYGNRRYGMVILSAPGKKKNRTVHSIVAQAFLGAQPVGTHVNHIDGQKHNNVISNLEYVTPKENIRHAIANNLRKTPEGAGHYRARISETDVVAIRAAFASGIPGKVLAAQYGMTHKGISNICCRKTWKHVA